MARRRRKRQHTRLDPMIMLVIGFLLGYLAAELFLARFVHPLHWLAAPASAVAGYTGVLLWSHAQRARGSDRGGR